MCVLILIPQRGGAYFPSPWTWVGFCHCLEEWNAQKWCCVTSKARSEKAMQSLLVSLGLLILGTQSPRTKEAERLHRQTTFRCCGHSPSEDVSLQPASTSSQVTKQAVRWLQTPAFELAHKMWDRDKLVLRPQTLPKLEIYEHNTLLVFVFNIKFGWLFRQQYILGTLVHSPSKCLKMSTLAG